MKSAVAASPDRPTLARRTLLSAVKAGRSPHALLLSGGDLTGLMAFTREVVEAHIGESVAAGHLDVHELQPAGKMRLILQEDALDAVNFAHLSSHSGRKCIIVREADRFKSESANTLLKTLEEPARGLLIILVTIHPYRLLPTILSRCARFEIGGVSPALSLPAWHDVEDTFTRVMQRAAEARGREANLMILEIYGLLSRIEHCHELLNQRNLDADPFIEIQDEPSDERKHRREAHESRIERQCRSLALAGLAERLRSLARQRPEAALAYAQALAALETADHRLQTLNVPALGAIEAALLGALRALVRG